ncbi:MAG: hypothetical protein N3D81_03670 [Spirochaetes bacterium]|nr:hypothetical protein [Spirochaetota bacterium]
MDNSRVLAIRDLVVSSFAPDFISYEYPYWYFEGTCSKDRDIIMEILEIIPDITIDGFSLKKISQFSYKYSVKFSFDDDKESFSEVFNSQDDFEEGDQ